MTVNVQNVPRAPGNANHDVGHLSTTPNGMATPLRKRETHPRTYTSPDFGDILRGYRERSGMSQVHLARRAGVNTSFISRMEAGQRNPIPEKVIALANAMPLSRTERERLLLSAGVWRHGVPDEAVVWALLALIGDDE